MSLAVRQRIGLAAAGAVVCLAGGGIWYKVQADREFNDPRAVLSRFPAGDAAVLSADFAAIRRAGLLDEPKAALEPDYRKFLDGTGFDYRRDLDSVTAAFSASGNYYIARGRFDWKKLRGYVAQQGGSCYEELCRMQGSTPGRRISFLPLRNDTIALAVSGDDLAATRLAKAGPPVTGILPSSPVWFSVPGAELAAPNALPPSMGAMLSALRTTERIVFTLEPADGGIEARMEATCRTPVDAGVLASQLRIATAALKESLSRDDEVGAALTAGSFDQSDRKVTGRWPVGKGLLESLTAGI